MTLKALANLTLKFYSDGTIKITDQQLSQAVMEGHLKNAYGAVISLMIEKRRKMGDLDQSYLFSGAIGEADFDVKRKGNKARIDMSEAKVMRLDGAMQIVGFDVPEKGCSCQQDELDLDISYVAPQEVKFYKGDGYSHLTFYALTGHGLDVYNLPECLDKIRISYAKDSGDVDIPADVCLQICKIAFPDIFGSRKIEKQKVDDSANEAIEQLKLQIANSQQ